MAVKNRTGVLLLLCSLAACGGGGDPPCTPVAVTLQIEGDSISTGAGTTDIANSPAYLLRAALPGVTVLMTGIGGTQTSERIYGGSGYLPFPQGVVGNLYLTEFGVNDARGFRDVATYKANIRKIASVPGAILQTPTPMDITRPLSEGASTAAYAQAVREVGAELGVPVADVQAYVLSLPNWQVLMAPDGVHPADALYRMMIGNVVLPVVAHEVGRLSCHL